MSRAGGGDPRARPIPVGPSILWPEKATKSTSTARTENGMCGTDWQASSTTSAPTALARADDGRHRVDRAQDVALVNERDDLGAVVDHACRGRRGRGGRRRSGASHASSAPVRRASSCHGTRLAWCSISVTTIRSPGPTRNRSASGPAVACIAHGVRDQVDRLGGVLGEHDLVELAADEVGDRCRGPPRRHRWPPRPARRRRDGPVRCCRRSELALGIEDGQRLLRRRTAVEEDQRIAAAHRSARIGKSRRMRSTSSGAASRWTDIPVSASRRSEVTAGVRARSRRPRARLRARGRHARRCGHPGRRAPGRALRSAGSGCSA